MRRTALSVAVALGLGGAATAETVEGIDELAPIEVTADAVDGDFRAETTTVGGKVPVALRDLPQSVTVINRAVLDAQGVSSLADALRNVPGITLGSAEGGQIGNNVNLRGFSARTDIYRNGFRDRGQYYRDTFDVNAIEVLKGPSSMLFGRGSTGGVINQVSKEPGAKERRDIGLSVGTGDRYRFTGDFNQPLGDDSALRVNVFDQDVHTTRDVMHAKDRGLAPTLRFGLGESTDIVLYGLLQHNRDMADYGIPALNGRPAPVAYESFYGLTDDRTEQDVVQLGARIEHRFGPDLALRSQTQWSRYDVDARESSANTIVTRGGVVLDRTRGNYTTVAPTDLFVQLSSRDRELTDRSLSNQTDLVAKFATGSFAHTMVGGIELGRDEFENQQFTRTGLPRLSLVDPEHVEQPASVVRAPRNRAESSADTLAFYVNDTIKLGEHWQLIAGVRRDSFDAEVDNSVSLPTHAEQDIGFTSVRGGVIWQPSQAQSYYASYGNSFNPSLETLTASNGAQNLDPERNRCLELGGKWSAMGPRLDLTAALFEVEKTDARTQVAPGEFTLDGDVRVRGVEVGATGHLMDRWQVFAGYAYLDAEIRAARDGTAGNRPANTPRHNGSVWTSFALSDAWELGGGMVYASERFAATRA